VEEKGDEGSPKLTRSAILRQALVLPYQRHRSRRGVVRCRRRPVARARTSEASESEHKLIHTYSRCQQRTSTVYFLCYRWQLFVLEYTCIPFISQLTSRMSDGAAGLSLAHTNPVRMADDLEQTDRVETCPDFDLHAHTPVSYCLFFI
jgi:hypothetical protein